MVQDIEGGYSKRIAFLAPDGPRWLLPLYELALMTAERAGSMGMDDVELTLVTPEPWPLADFGRPASEAVTDRLEAAGIQLYAMASAEVPASGQLLIQPHAIELRPDRMIAMPRVTGPAIRGIPGSATHGFIPIDSNCAVPGTGGARVRRGRRHRLPIKHGGLGAQQADTAAAAIARLAGLDVEATPYHPVMHGMLLTGGKPLYLSARIVGGRGFESEVSDEPLWSPPEKVDAEELGAYLSSLTDST